MNENESLFARWSRRKREAAAEARQQQDRPAAALDPAKLAAAEPEAPALPNLPPVDAIDSKTDIAQFLASGVPVELTRTALRRAWTADPAIRDFIGLSENAWDFNAPDVPGFGSLDVEQIRRLAEQLLGEPTPSQMPAPEASAAPIAAPEADLMRETDPGRTASPANIAAMQDEQETQDEQEKTTARELAARRHHGGALPQ